MRRALLVVLGCAVLAAGCIPPRDNPHDPDNLLPDPTVEVQVLTSAAGVVTVQSFARRNVAFILDASGTTDPEGRALSFEWDLDREPGFEFPGASLPFVNLTTSDRPVVIPQVDASDYPASGVGVAPVRFRVRVTAGENVVEREIDIAVTNDAPRIDTGDEIVVPAALGSTVTLDPCGAAIDCTSKDPDGDTLRSFTWTQLPAETVAFTVLDSAGHWSFTAPSTAGVLLFELTASDGIASSSAHQVVRIGPQAWSRTDERLTRFHVEERVSANFSISNTSLDQIFAEPVTGDVWVAGQNGGGGTEVRRLGPDGVSVLGSWLLLHNGPKSIAASGIGGWVAHDDGFSRVVTGVPAVDMTTSPAFDVANDRGSAISPDGQWFLSRRSLYRDTGDGIPALVANVPGGGEFFRNTLTVDADGVPWVAGLDKVFRLQGTSLQIRYNGVVDSLAPHPDGGVWIVSREDEVLEIKHLLPSGAVEDEAILFGGDPGEDCQLAYEDVSETLWLFDGIDLYRFRYRAGFLDPAERFKWEDEFLLSSSNQPRFRSLAPDSLRASLAFSADILDFGGNPTGVGRLGTIHPGLTGASLVPGFTPQATFIGTMHRLSIDPTRGLWAKERFDGGITRITASGIRLATDAFVGEAIIGPFSKLDGGAYGVSYSQLDAGLALSEIGPDGSPLGSVTLSGVQEIFDVAFAGNENGACLVGATSSGSGSPVRIAKATATMTEYSSTLTWDGFSIEDAAIAPDGGTCWFAETAGGNRIITASGVTATRSTSLAQLTVALAADPRTGGGVWRADAAGAITRFAGGAGSLTAIATPVTALAIEKVCETSATASCVNVWYAVPGFVVRARTDGTVIQQFKAPGYVDDLAVR